MTLAELIKATIERQDVFKFNEDLTIQFDGRETVTVEFKLNAIQTVEYLREQADLEAEFINNRVPLGRF